MLYNNDSAWNSKKGRPGQFLIGKYMLAEINSKNTALKKWRLSCEKQVNI